MIEETYPQPTNKRMLNLAQAVNHTYFYSRLIMPIQEGRLLQESPKAKIHAQELYKEFRSRTKEITTKTLESFEALLGLLKVNGLENLRWKSIMIQERVH